MKKITSSTKKAKIKDSRLWCGEERLHPLIGHSLPDGAEAIRQTTDDLAFRNEDFSRAALPVLEAVGAIILVHPAIRIPEWLPEREQKLAKRHPHIPIWMPTRAGSGGKLHDYFARLLDVIEEALRKELSKADVRKSVGPP
jgi:hypothetical protein